MSRRAELRLIGSLATVFAMLVALLGVSGAPAQAHSAGKAVVLVRQFTLTPSANTWQASVTVADFDSGAPIRNSSVVTVIGAQKTTLAPTKVIGVYQGTIPNAKPGPTNVELQIRTIPGSDPVQPYDKTWPVNLVAGQPLQVVSGDSGGGGGSNIGLILGVAGGVLAVALLYGLFVIRRRTAVPAQAKVKRA
jgi:hypothetical protein